MNNIHSEAFHNCKYCPMARVITGKTYASHTCTLSGEELETEFDQDKHFFTAKNQPCQLTTIKQQKIIEKTKGQIM